MNSRKITNRRQAIKILALASFGGFSTTSSANSPKIGAMIPGKGWVTDNPEECTHNGTPLQFIPKTVPDPNPLENELKKYPKCPYCGMDRTQWQHSRHIVQYDDNLVDGTCSIHCLSVSLSLNIDRGPKTIYAADFGSDAKIKPLINVDDASYLIDSKLKGTMTAKSKMAFASAQATKAAQQKNGGTLGNFDDALTAAYLGMADDTILARKRRSERRKKMMKKMNMK